MELYHHGILGMKWGVRRYQNPDGSLTPAGMERYGKKFKEIYAEKDDSKIKYNSDGSKTYSKNYVFNRVGKDTLQFNESGGLYVSSDRPSAMQYVVSLGPNLVAKILNEEQTHVQQIRSVKNIKEASEEQTVEAIIKVAKSDKQYYEIIRDHFMYGAGIDDELYEKAINNPKSNEAKRLAYAFCASFGNSAIKDKTKKVYDELRKNGFDAMPDIYDIYNATSKTPMIIINPDSVKLDKVNIITKDVMKDAKYFIKGLDLNLELNDVLKDGNLSIFL